MATAKLFSTFRISIPKVILENLQLKAGQRFVLVTRGQVIELIPAQAVQAARGLLSGAGTATAMDYREHCGRNAVST